MLLAKRMWLGLLPAGPESLARLAPWVTVALLPLLAYALAELSWRLWPVAALPQPVITASSFTPSAAASPQRNLDQIANLHLFGRADAPVAATPAPISAPETRLNLTLKGLVAASTQQEARAIIAQGNTDGEVYRVGDSLSGGALVHEIHADRVILSRAGRFETLTLPKERMDTQNPAAAPMTANPRPGVDAGSPGIMPQQLRELRGTLLQNPQDAMRLIAGQPVVEDGKIRGYRVRPGQDRNLFNSIGLRPGDVVTAINGIPLGEPAQLGALMEQLSSASSLSVSVERQGQQTELNLNLE